MKNICIKTQAHVSTLYSVHSNSGVAWSHNTALNLCACIHILWLLTRHRSYITVMHRHCACIYHLLSLTTRICVEFRIAQPNLQASSDENCWAHGCELTSERHQTSLNGHNHFVRMY